MSPAEIEAARRNITIPPSLWAAVVEAAAHETIDTGAQVSAAEWIRRALKERLASQSVATKDA